MASPQKATSAASISRRPYRGSCHCGDTRYIAFLSFPPVIDTHHFCDSEPKPSIRIYKCNCSTCQKMGFFHVRMADSPRDFCLLSPLNPESGGLGDYKCFSERIHWFFCKKCAVRCFAIMGEGEVREVDALELGENGGEGGKMTKLCREVDALELGENGEEGGKMTKVWTPKAEGWVEGKTGYLSVNAATLEPGQDGLNLREWTEKGWICYMDCKDEEDHLSFKEPYEGGIY